MSSSIEDKVVSMKFDNTSFEKNVASSISMLDRLKASLNFSKAGESFAAIDTAAKGVSLESIGTAVDGIANKFNAMSIVAITALTNIVNKAVDAGLNFAKSFSFGPLTEGFKEYETNINSVQTILSNTMADNTTLEDVTIALDELNAYADNTIYNFSEMAKNIGTFTAAGVDLETSVGAIKGIANLAAISGSNAQQASNAMYQLSQAIASGTVRLQDWNSVQNAGLGGQVFQNALFETAKQMGEIKNIDMDTTFEEWTAAQGSFRESLGEVQKEVPDAAEKIAMAEAEASEIIEDANQSSAEAVENATDRIIEARKAADRAVTQGAERIADAEKYREESAVASAEKIAYAEESKVEVFKRADDDIKRAVEAQNRTIEDSAKNVERAFDRVTEARERLQKALEPESADKLEAATDRLTAAQLDQEDSSRDIEKAYETQEDAARAASRSREEYLKLLNDPRASQEDISAASEKAEKAQERLLDVQNVVERARLRQKAIARAVTQAEEDLEKAKAKGTSTDENVIAAQENLDDALASLARTQEDAVAREQEAAENVEKVTLASAKRREEAIQRVIDAQNESAEVAISAEKKVSEAVIASQEAQVRAAENLQKAEEDKVKIVERAEEQVAAAHERAAERISAAQEDVLNEPPGWLTDEVLLTTLQTFTGDLTEQQLIALGYSEEQAKEMYAIGQNAVSAASDVKTLTQLIGTTREALSSGWAESFRIIFGNFDQAKGTFTDLSNAIGDFLGPLADARNERLLEWLNPKEDGGLGGRVVLFEGLRNVFEAIASVLKPIGAAFREIFPRKSAQDLFDLTVRFRDFTEKLKIGADTAEVIKKVFKAVFSVFNVGIAIVKGLFKILGALFGGFSGAGGGLLDFIGGLADGITKVSDIIANGAVDAIVGFFTKIPEAIGDFFSSIPFGGAASRIVDGLKTIINGILDFFGLAGGAVGTAAGGVADGVGATFDGLKTVVGGIGSGLEFTVKTLQDLVTGVVDGITSILNGIGAVFSGIGSIFGGIFEGANEAVDGGGADWDKIFKAFELLLGGGFLAGFLKIANNGINIDFFGGLFSSLSDALDGLTVHLKALTLEVKANALLKIAGAIAILAASMIALSFVDAGSLAKSLAAMTAGLGLLVSALAILEKSTEDSSGRKLLAIATGLLLIAGAVAILSLSLLILSTMDIQDTGQSLLALTGVLILMTNSVQAFSKNSDGLIKAGIGLNIIAVGLIILAAALKVMSTIDLVDAAVGLANIAATLAVLRKVLTDFPDNSISIGFGLMTISVGLLAMAGALWVLSTMELKTVVEGVAYAAGIIAAIGTALTFFPEESEMLKVSTAMVLLAGALGVMSLSIRSLASLSVTELLKGLGAIVAALIVLARATNTIKAKLGSGLAILAIATALKKLVEVLEHAGKLDLPTILKGMGILVGVLIALAVTLNLIAPTIPILAALGTSLLTLAGAIGILLGGIGLFLIGMSDFLVAVRGGTDGLSEALTKIISFIPDFVFALVSGFADGFIQLAKTIADAAPELIESALKIILQLLDAIIEITPKLAETLKTLILEGLGVVSEVAPEIVATGLGLLLNLLKGISDNIGEISITVVEIITKFIEALGTQAGVIISAGLSLLENLLLGIAENLGNVVTAVGTIITAVAEAFVDQVDNIIAIGVSFLEVIVSGILSATQQITDGIITLIGMFADGFIEALKVGGEKITEVLAAGVEFVKVILAGVLSATKEMIDAMGEFIVELLDAMAEGVRKYDDEIRDAGWNLATAILDAVTFGLSSRAGNIMESFIGNLNPFDNSGKVLKALPGVISKNYEVFGEKLGESTEKGFNDRMQIKSPSRVMIAAANNVVSGLAIGLSENKDAMLEASLLGQGINRKINETLNRAAVAFAGIEEYNPKITPVLDLSLVEKEATKLGSILTTSELNARASFEQARALVVQEQSRTQQDQETQTQQTPTEVKFEQNIYSPDRLSIAEVYRQTNNQIEMFKQELATR